MATTTRRSTVLEEVLAHNRGRKPKRLRLKLHKMNESPFAFFRGADHLFASAWTAIRPPEPGPEVLLCGDLHLENFGVYEDAEGVFHFDINDFDEAIVAPASVDLVRCTASIFLAAELWHLTPLTATGMALDFLEAYRGALKATAEDGHVRKGDPAAASRAAWALLGPAALADPLKLLDHATQKNRRGERRIVRRADKRPPVRASRASLVRKAVEKYGRSTRTPQALRVIDVTARIAGIGSLGLRRYLVLVEGDGSPDGNRLIDIKQVVGSALDGLADAVRPDFGPSEAHRAVRAQLTLQARPALGLDVLKMGGRWYRMRQMIPEENRTTLDRFQNRPEKLRDAIKEAGCVTARSHLRGTPARHRKRRTEALTTWASGPELDAVLASAARCAERTRLEYEQFHTAMKDRSELPRALRPGAKGE